MTRERRAARRAAWPFATALAACGAFLVGAVCLWGIPLDSLGAKLAAVLLFVASLIALACLTVVGGKLAAAGFRRVRGGRGRPPARR
ncbi:MAG: hypothetical protein KatS3mg124_0878 [Porticoccaceae bacterium]|nr:MAG: hypothetical protein KatS3mg124_0878 [Porticoccaceae bacterium]